MIISQKNLGLMAVLCFGFILSACTPPQPDQQTQLDIFGQPQTENLESLDNQSFQNSTNQPEGNMKSIEDFQLIEATQAVINTTKGPITIELSREEAPLTTLNFLNLAQDGFYDGVVFHRVIPDFMAQVGDPLSKDPSQEALWGSGGPGYQIPDEFSSNLKHDSAGIVSMANSGPNSGGSQFFITFEATPWLDGKHAVFGKVTEGLDVLTQIEIGDKIESIDLSL